MHRRKSQNRGTRHVTRAILGLTALIVCGAITPSAARSVAIDDKPPAAFIEGQLAEQHIPGLAVAIVADGVVVWAKGFGYADLDTRRPVTPDTLFLNASVSKTMVAAALMHAVEHERFGLDADIGTLLPFPVRNPLFPTTPITVRNLAAHSSGIIDNDGLLSGRGSNVGRTVT